MPAIRYLFPKDRSLATCNPPLSPHLIFIYLTPCRFFLASDPIPLYPPSPGRGRGKKKKEGLPPLLDAPLASTSYVIEPEQVPERHLRQNNSNSFGDLMIARRTFELFLVRGLNFMSEARAFLPGREEAQTSALSFSW